MVSYFNLFVAMNLILSASYVAYAYAILGCRLVQQRMRMSFQQSLQYLWQRVIRGRYYRHLMKEAGYK